MSSPASQFKERLGSMADLELGDFQKLKSVDDIPSGSYMVYVLTYKGKAVVVGHGKKNRAKVIFDTKERITFQHFKALLVRCYVLFGEGEDKFGRRIIKCNSKDEAREKERVLHKKIGGNSNVFPKEIEEKLFCGLDKTSSPGIFLKMALLSSYSGIYDLKKWKKYGIIDDEAWGNLSKRLEIETSNGEKRK